MNIYNKGTILAFQKKYPETKKALSLWYHDIKAKHWKSPNEVKQDFATASVLKRGRVVFNIMGNKYRLVAEINYEKGWLFIKFIGTHQSYNRIDANTVNQF